MSSKESKMEGWQLIRYNDDLHTQFKRIHEDDPDSLDEAGVYQCGHCNGTGLKHKDPHRPCTNCLGIGYLGFKELKGESVCPDCNSTGKQLEYENHVTDCETCDGFGRLDWVTAIRKGIDLEKIW